MLMEEPMTELRIKDAERLAHAYIISAQSQEESLREATVLASAAVCTGFGQHPCGNCRDCRKVQNDIHPDVIQIARLTDDKGRLKKEISVDQIRQMAADAYIRPNEAERKVYVIKEAELMNDAAQNAALKLLEEPPQAVMFLLCTCNAAALLPTVRSRCAEINCGGEKAEESGETAKLAKAYLKAVATGDKAQLYKWCAANDGIDGRAAAEFVFCTENLLADMLCGRAPDRGMSRSQLLRLSALMGKCSGYMKVNVGVKHIFGLLAVQSIAEDRNRG